MYNVFSTDQLPLKCTSKWIGQFSQSTIIYKMRTFAACRLSDMSISCFSPFSLVPQTDKQVWQYLINGNLSLLLVPLSWVNDKSIQLNNPFLQPHVKPYSKAQNHSYTCYNPKRSSLCGFSFFQQPLAFLLGLTYLLIALYFLSHYELLNDFFEKNKYI